MRLDKKKKKKKKKAYAPTALNAAQKIIFPCSFDASGR